MYYWDATNAYLCILYIYSKVDCITTACKWPKPNNYVAKQARIRNSCDWAVRWKSSSQICSPFGEELFARNEGATLKGWLQCTHRWRNIGGFYSIYWVLKVPELPNTIQGGINHALSTHQTKCSSGSGRNHVSWSCLPLLSLQQNIYMSMGQHSFTCVFYYGIMAAVPAQWPCG